MSRRRTISPSKLIELEQENRRFSVSEPASWSGSILDLPSPPSSKREQISSSSPVRPPLQRVDANASSSATWEGQRIVDKAPLVTVLDSSYDIGSLNELVWMLTEPSNEPEDIQCVALEIETLTGNYPSGALSLTPGRTYPGPMPVVSNASKRELLTEMKSYMVAMNQEKNEEVEEIMSATGCRGKRDQESGTYVYRDAAGTAIDLFEFETRYSAFVDARQLERWASTASHEWFSSCDNLVNATGERSETSPTCSSPLGSSNRCEPIESLGGRARKTLSPSQIRAIMKHEEESTDSVLAENEVTPTELETFAKPTSDGPEEARAAAVEAAEKRLFAAWEAALARFHEEKAAIEVEFPPESQKAAT